MSQAPLESRRVVLRPLTPELYRPLFDAVNSDALIRHWRYHGATSSLEDFARLIWDNVFAQFVIVGRASNTVAGLVQVLSPNFRHGTAQIAALVLPECQTKLWPIEGVLVFTNYLFVQFNFRKLYGEVPGMTYGQFSSGAGRFFDVEGILKEHEWHDGRWWDTYIVAIERSKWLTDNRRILERIFPDDRLDGPPRPS